MLLTCLVSLAVVAVMVGPPAVAAPPAAPTADPSATPTAAPTTTPRVLVFWRQSTPAVKAAVSAVRQQGKALGLYAKLLGYSGLGKYRDPLEQVLASNASALLKKHDWRNNPSLPPAARLASLPVTDKASYIRAYSTEERCLDGRIPLAGTQIDESSGSTGIPYNWVRS